MILKQYQRKIDSNRYSPGWYDIWSLGITVVIGGQYFGWNTGLSAGFISYLIVTLIIASGYISLIFSISEIISALPFSGGAYGLARCTIGYYPGFLIGCCESMEYIFYVSASAISLSQMICSSLQISTEYSPLIWFIFYTTSLFILIQSGKLFWRFNYFIAFISILLILVYSFGCLPWVDFMENAPSDSSNSNKWFVGGMNEVMFVYPLACWFYVGIESLAFTSNMLDNPKRDVPIGSIACIFTLVCTSILVLFVCSSLYPGVELISISTAPLNNGFIDIFHVSLRYASVLSIPATYATAFGFIFAYGKLLHAMSSSNLLPQFLNKSTRNDSPYMSMIFGSCISYAVCLLVNYRPNIGLYIYNICILSGFLTYISQSISYIRLKTRYSTITREFHSPLGVYGAYYSILVFTIGIISVCAFQRDQGRACLTVIILCTLFSIYYVIIAKNNQTFSSDEQKILFTAQVIKFNLRMRNNIRTGYKSPLSMKETIMKPLMVKPNVIDFSSTTDKFSKFYSKSFSSSSPITTFYLSNSGSIDKSESKSNISKVQSFSMDLLDSKRNHKVYPVD